MIRVSVTLTGSFLPPFSPAEGLHLVRRYQQCLNPADAKIVFIIIASGERITHTSIPYFIGNPKLIHNVFTQIQDLYYYYFTKFLVWITKKQIFLPCFC